MKRKLAGAMGVLAVSYLTAFAAEDPAKAPAANSGREMYQSYCASCHGVAGRGDGPAAPTLKALPTDLTTLARRNGGRFPAVRVYQSVEGSATVAAHGPRTMPVWGTVFRQRSGANEAQVRLRIRNLTKFIESLQVK